MRKFIIFLLCMAFAAIFTAVSAYMMYNADILQERVDYGFGDVVVEDGQASLEVYFYEEATRNFSKYTTVTSEQVLYIRIFGSYKDKGKQKPDESGYIYLDFSIPEDITEIRYVTKNSTYSIWKKEE